MSVLNFNDYFAAVGLESQRYPEYATRAIPIQLNYGPDGDEFVDFWGIYRNPQNSSICLGTLPKANVPAFMTGHREYFYLREFVWPAGAFHFGGGQHGAEKIIHIVDPHNRATSETSFEANVDFSLVFSHYTTGELGFQHAWANLTGGEFKVSGTLVAAEYADGFWQVVLRLEDREVFAELPDTGEQLIPGQSISGDAIVTGFLGEPAHDLHPARGFELDWDRTISFDTVSWEREGAYMIHESRYSAMAFDVDTAGELWGKLDSVDPHIVTWENKFSIGNTTARSASGLRISVMTWVDDLLVLAPDNLALPWGGVLAGKDLWFHPTRAQAESYYGDDFDAIELEAPVDYGDESFIFGEIVHTEEQPNEYSESTFTAMKIRVGGTFAAIVVNTETLEGLGFDPIGFWVSGCVEKINSTRELIEEFNGELQKRRDDLVLEKFRDRAKKLDKPDVSVLEACMILHCIPVALEAEYSFLEEILEVSLPRPSLAEIEDEESKVNPNQNGLEVIMLDEDKAIFAAAACQYLFESGMMKHDYAEESRNEIIGQLPTNIRDRAIRLMNHAQANEFEARLSSPTVNPQMTRIRDISSGIAYSFENDTLIEVQLDEDEAFLAEPYGMSFGENGSIRVRNVADGKWYFVPLRRVRGITFLKSKFEPTDEPAFDEYLLYP